MLITNNKQTDRQTNPDENITILEEIIKEVKSKTSNNYWY